MITTITIEGVVFNLRFDLGTARIVKQLSGSDIFKEGFAGDTIEVAANIFLAGYKRYTQFNKQDQVMSDEDILNYYYALNIERITEITAAFTSALTVITSVKKVNSETQEAGAEVDEKNF